MIALYIFCIGFFGYFMYYLFNKLKLLANLNTFEILSTSILFGIFFYGVYVFLLEILKIKFSRLMLLPFFLASIVGFLLFAYKIIKNKEYKINFKKLKKENIALYMLSFTLISLLINKMIVCLSSNLIFPDEFSAWGLNAKAIFEGRSIFEYIKSGFSGYPFLFPSLYSGYYFLVGKVQENAIRIISSMTFLALIFNFIGLAKKKKLNLHFILLMFIFIIFFYDAFCDYTFSTYVDLPFASFYTLSLIYLFEYLLVDKSKTNLVLSSIYFSAICITKSDGLPYFVFYIVVIVIYCIVRKFNPNKLDKIDIFRIIIYSVGCLLMGVLWKIYQTNALNGLTNFSGVAPASVTSFNIQYLSSILQNLFNQQLNQINWCILFILFIISIFKNGNNYSFKKRLYLLFGILAILFSIAFMIFCYLTIFGDEALIAPSYIRYITRVLFIFVYIVALSFSQDKI